MSIHWPTCCFMTHVSRGHVYLCSPQHPGFVQTLYRLPRPLSSYSGNLIHCTFTHHGERCFSHLPIDQRTKLLLGKSNMSNFAMMNTKYYTWHTQHIIHDVFWHTTYCWRPRVGSEDHVGWTTLGSQQTHWNRRPSHTNKFVTRWVANRPRMPITRPRDFGSSI